MATASRTSIATIAAFSFTAAGLGKLI